MRAQWIAPPAAVAKVAYRLARVLAAPTAAYVAFRVEEQVVGWITPERAQRLARWSAVFEHDQNSIAVAARLSTPDARTAALAEVARTLAVEGALTAWRDERYAVAIDPVAPVLFEVERAAARYFGIHTFAAHANGLVGDAAGWRMWLARRSATKAIDPGLLDNLVGGGIASGTTPRQAIIREAWEEAGIGEDIARHAPCVGSVELCRDRPDGLQRETIYMHDFWLPMDFAPANQDGEVVEYRLGAADDIMTVLATDLMTGDASLVVVDFLLRRGHVGPDDPSLGALQALLHPPLSRAHCTAG